MLAPAYRACSLIADIGPCMRRLLSKYPTKARRETLVPWALDEPDGVKPPDTVEREWLFPGAKLGLLYSGSFGRAHSYSDILLLADFLASMGGCVTFSVRGNREVELRAAVKESGSAVRFVPPVVADKLGGGRLASADIPWFPFGRSGVERLCRRSSLALSRWAGQCCSLGPETHRSRIGSRSITLDGSWTAIVSLQSVPSCLPMHPTLDSKLRCNNGVSTYTDNNSHETYKSINGIRSCGA